MKAPFKKQIVIIGSGISGLSLAHYLSKSPQFDVRILEKQAQPGGWMRTKYSDAGLFERGPRGVRLRGQAGQSFYDLACEIGLESDFITARRESASRYIYLDGQLQPVSKQPIGWLFSKATRHLPLALLLECFRRSPSHVDMSVEDFFIERLGAQVYQNLIEPVLLGIFGTRGRLLSAKSCLPTLWKWREQSGSLVMGALKLLWNRTKASSALTIPTELSDAELVSFQGGMSQLIDGLYKELKDKIQLSEPLLLLNHNKPFQLQTAAGSYRADIVIFACNPWALDTLVWNKPKSWSGFRSTLASKSLILVHLAYREPISPSLGFGYLVPPDSSQALLGVVIDSNSFPHHNRHYPTRITAMMNSEEATTPNQYKQMAQMALAKHLKWHHLPAWCSITQAIRSLPVSGLGCSDNLSKVYEELEQGGIPLYFTGLGYRSQSVTQCVLHAKELALDIIHKHA